MTLSLTPSVKQSDDWSVGKLLEPDMTDPNQVPSHLQSTFRMLSSAFPDGPDANDYLALVAILGEEMSHRVTAQVIEELGYCPRHQGYNDVLAALSEEFGPAAEALERVRARLRSYGLNAWLAEFDC